MLSLGSLFCLQGEVENLVGKEVISTVSHHSNPSTIYVATQNSVFLTEDGGKNWDQIYHIKEANKKINSLAQDDENLNNIYVAAQNGLYKGINKGKRWIKVFKGSNDLENNCFCVEVINKSIYLGTKQGLFVSKDKGMSWQKIGNQLIESIIMDIATGNKNGVIYVACEKGVLCSQDKGVSWKRIFVVYDSDIPLEDLADYDSEISTKLSPIKVLYRPNTINKLYVVASSGIYLTKDKGNSWQRIIQSGLPNLNINSLVEWKKKLICGSDNGIFQLNEYGWEKLDSSRKEALRKTYDLFITKDSLLWFSTENGIYNTTIFDREEEAQCNQVDFNEDKFRNNIKSLFSEEPTIEEVHKAAIEYAEVSIDKIKRWRLQSKLKSLLPSFSIGYDKVIYGSSSGAMAIGPRDWNFDLSWDLSDFVWSSDQTSIDSRSRLTVQLRQDILEQVTYYYFERRKLKYELHYEPPQQSKEKFLKKLELERITAILDAFTNNYFSNYLTEKSLSK